MRIGSNVLKFCAAAGYDVFVIFLVYAATKNLYLTIGCAVLLAAAFLFFRKFLDELMSSTLLLDAVFVLSNLLLFHDVRFWPMTVSLGVVGIACAVYWWLYSMNSNVDWNAIKEQLCLPIWIDAIFIVVGVFNMVEMELWTNPFAWLVILVFAFDLVRHLLKRSPSETDKQHE